MMNASSTKIILRSVLCFAALILVTGSPSNYIVLRKGAIYQTLYSNANLQTVTVQRHRRAPSVSDIFGDIGKIENLAKPEHSRKGGANGKGKKKGGNRRDAFTKNLAKLKNIFQDLNHPKVPDILSDIGKIEHLAKPKPAPKGGAKSSPSKSTNTGKSNKKGGNPQDAFNKNLAKVKNILKGLTPKASNIFSDIGKIEHSAKPGAKGGATNPTSNKSKSPGTGNKKGGNPQDDFNKTLAKLKNIIKDLHPGNKEGNNNKNKSKSGTNNNPNKKKMNNKNNNNNHNKKKKKNPSKNNRNNNNNNKKKNSNNHNNKKRVSSPKPNKMSAHPKEAGRTANSKHANPLVRSRAHANPMTGAIKPVNPLAGSKPHTSPAVATKTHANPVVGAMKHILNPLAGSKPHATLPATSNKHAKPAVPGKSPTVKGKGPLASMTLPVLAHEIHPSLNPGDVVVLTAVQKSLFQRAWNQYSRRYGRFVAKAMRNSG